MSGVFNIEVDLIVTITAVFVAGLAAVLGIWMERDPKKPPRYAWALSALILLATGVSLMQSVIDKQEQDLIRDDMARLLTTMERMATESDDPELLELVKSELNAQSRSNPEIVEKVAQRVSDEGRDASEVLGKHLDAAEVEKVARKGVIKVKETDKTSRDDKDKEVVERSRRVRADEEKEGREAPDDPRRPAAAARAARAAEAEAAAAPPAPVVPIPTPTPTPLEAVAPPKAPPDPAAARRPLAGKIKPAKPGKPKKPAGRKPAR